MEKKKAIPRKSEKEKFIEVVNNADTEILANLYANIIMKDLKFARGRAHYKQLCKYITKTHISELTQYQQIFLFRVV